jgi:hypothetical protein
MSGWADPLPARPGRHDERPTGVALGEASAHVANYGSNVTRLLSTTLPLTVTGT